MRVDIPARDCLSYLDDHDLVFRYGGRWNKDKSCYEFEQSDIEAYMKVLDGQWRLVNG